MTEAMDLALSDFSENARLSYERSIDIADNLTLELDDFTIRTKADEAQLNELLGNVKVAIGNIEEARKKQVEPLNAKVKTINDLWRKPRAALEALEAAAKRTLTIWLQAERERIAKEQAEARRLQEEQARKAAEADRQEQEALARAEAAKNSKAREKALADAKAAADRGARAALALVDARIAEPMEAPRGVKTDTATTGLVAKWAYQVTDSDKVPREFLMVDEKKVRAAIATGVRQIDGITIYQDEILATRISQR